MKILSIDTSADETSAAVTENTTILSNVIWSQASLHAKWGGVVPSLAQRAHEERIDFVIEKALITSHQSPITDIDAVAVTVGPGLAIALGVGIDRAKKLTEKYKKPLIAVNHLEAHILSPFANPKSEARNPKQIPNTNIKFPNFGLVVSGGNTQLLLVEEIGKYKILVETSDDALGEALDKAARMLGLGYPGGAILEKFSKDGDAKGYKLPIPLVGQEKKMKFSYSGLKTAMYRLVESEKPLTKQKIYNLAACFQDVAFSHLLRVLNYVLTNHQSLISSHLLVGGGVASNIELRKRLRNLGKKINIKVHFPYTKKLCTDNAAMIGVAAYFKSQRGEFVKDIAKVDRMPNVKLEEKFKW